MNGTQIGLANLVALSATLVGARLSAELCQRHNPLVSFQLCLATLATSTGLTALWVQGPEQVHLYYFFSALQGMSLGWLLPTERVLFCTLSPTGGNDEAEMMGLLLCVHSSASRLPPLLFSVVNEAGYSLRWALSSEIVLLGTAIALSFGIGGYDEAVRQARDPQRTTSTARID